MADKYVSMENLRFLLYDVHQIARLLQLDRFSEYDRESIDILLDSVKDLADQEFFPCYQEMDEKPVQYADGKITVHPQVEKCLGLMAELGLIAAIFDEKDGGLQLPSSINAATNHILDAANNHISGYAGLTAGAAHLITSFGSQELIDRYVSNMLVGKWTGTMALTEPQAGSSLSDITTSAHPTDQGHYMIKGQKIFISGGDQQFSESIVHLTLARIEGAPAGTRGISLFVVPRHRPVDAGGVEYNDVYTAGDYEKLGQRGYATAHLTFGENDNCRGWLVGEPNMGLRYMFQMMNGARISVGLHATSVATAAYHASLQYAKERPQGRRLGKAGEKDLSVDQALIIEHPDVRRMLLLQKAVVEGALSLLLQSTVYKDMLDAGDEAEREKNHLLLEILTPIAKTFPSEMGIVSISNGLQVLGGYGFCMDFPLQLYYRDIRIMSIYEGTTGIQALDLLGRKVTQENGKALKLLAGEIQETIQAAMADEVLAPYAKILADKLGLYQKVLQHLIGFAMKGNFERFLADATVFMEFSGIIVVAWQWLKMGQTAKQALNNEQLNFSPAFYEAKIHTMKFYYNYEVPRTSGLAETLMSAQALTLNDNTVFDEG